MKIQSHVWDRRFYENTHPYTIIYPSMKITTWLNPTSDYGKFSGDAFADRIIMPF